MDATRYFGLGILAFMAIAAVSIFAYRIASRSRSELEAGGVVPYISILGVFGFLAGVGLLVYDQHGFLRLGLGLAASGLLALFASYFVAQKQANRRPDA